MDNKKEYLKLSHSEGKNYLYMQIAYIFVLAYLFYLDGKGDIYLVGVFHAENYLPFHLQLAGAIGSNIIYFFGFLFYLVKGLFKLEIMICSNRTLIAVNLGLHTLVFITQYILHS